MLRASRCQDTGSICEQHPTSLWGVTGASEPRNPCRRAIRAVRSLSAAVSAACKPKRRPGAFQVDDLIAAICERWIAEQRLEEAEARRIISSAPSCTSLPPTSLRIPGSSSHATTVIRKAIALGIDIEDAAGLQGDNVIAILDHLQRRP